MTEFWVSCSRVVAGTLAIYLFLVLALRLIGRRLMGQLTALDLLIILLLGSAVESSLIGPAPTSTDTLFHNPNVALSAGLVSAATLLLTNRLLNLVLYRFKRLRHLVLGGPLILVHDGLLVEAHLHRAGLTEANLMEAIRERGYASVKEIRFAVLELNGEIHVLPMTDKPFRCARPNVEG